MSEAGAARQRPRWRRALFNTARAGLGLGLLYIVLRGTDAWTDPVILRDAAWLLAPAALLTLFGAAVEAVRLCLLLRAQEIFVSPFDVFRLVSVSTLWSFVAPGGVGGDLAKAVYLGRRDRGRLVEVGMTLVVDRFVGLMSMLFSIVAAAALCTQFVASSALLTQLVIWAGGAWAILLGAFCFGVSEGLRRTRLFVWATTKAPLARFSRRMSDAVGAFGRRTREVGAAFGVSLIGNVGLAVTFTLAASEFAPGLEGPRPALLSLLGMLANVIPATPAGLGVGEAAFDALFRHAGHGNGSLVSLTWRFGMAFVALLGAVFYAWGVRLDSPPEEESDVAG